MVGKFCDGFTKHREPVLDGKAGSLVRVHAHRHDEVVKELHSLLDHPEMSDGERIEAAGIDSQPATLLGRFHGHRIATPAKVSVIKLRPLWAAIHDADGDGLNRTKRPGWKSDIDPRPRTKLPTGYFFGGAYWLWILV